MEVKSKIYNGNILPPLHTETNSVSVLCYNQSRVDKNKLDPFIGYYNYSSKMWLSLIYPYEKTCDYWMYIPDVFEEMKKRYRWDTIIKKRSNEAEMMVNKIKIMQHEKETYSISDAFYLLFDCVKFLLNEKIKQEKTSDEAP